MYFGFKYDTNLSQVNTPELLLSKLSSILPKVANTNFVEGISLLGLELTGNNDYFLQGSPSKIELGINNNWNSAGPCTIWKEGEPMPTRETMADKLKGHDILLQNKLSFMCMEHIFNQPSNHWLSVEVSNQTEGEYTLDQAFAVEIAQLTFN
jgi:hypothetical protein